jgi:hypothetical protein
MNAPKNIDMPSSPDVLIFDAITHAIKAAQHFQSVDHGGACMNLAPILRQYAEILECGMWQDHEAKS